MIILALVVISIAVIILCYVAYCNYRDNRVFRGDKFEETYVVKEILNTITPKPGDRKYLRLSDYIFCLDSKRTIRDLYLAKAITLIAFFIIGVLIVSTNVYNRYINTFEVTADMPIEITKEDFNTLSLDLEFTKQNRQKDLDLLTSNIGLLADSNKVIKFSSTPVDDLYYYITNINASLKSIFRFTDIIFLIVLASVGYALPTFVISKLMNLMMSNSLFEFDELETDIYLMAEKQVDDILEILHRNSLFFREMFKGFRTHYLDDKDDAYRTVFTRPEFPDRFVTLIRYLNMIDNSGSAYTKVVIEANKKNTEERVMRQMRAISSKRTKFLGKLVVASFMTGIVRVLIALFSLSM